MGGCDGVAVRRELLYPRLCAPRLVALQAALRPQQSMHYTERGSESPEGVPTPATAVLGLCGCHEAMLDSSTVRPLCAGRCRWPLRMRCAGCSLILMILR